MSQPRSIEAKLTRRGVPDGFPPHAILPDYSGFSILSVPALIEAAFGRTSANALVEEISPPRAERVLLLIVDGLGYRALERFRRENVVPAVNGLAERGTCVPLTSVFPSTTVTAMTSLATGLPPISHGMVGYRLYLRETSSITDMIRLRPLDGDGAPFPEGKTPDLDALRPASTHFERLTASGVEAHVLLPRAIAGSGLSQILYQGASHVTPAVGFADMCVQARTILESANGPTAVTMYWPGLDSVAHARGPETDACRAEAAAIDAVLGQQLIGRLEGTLLLITSDHGFVTMAADDYRELSAFGDLPQRLSRLPVGEPRASYFYIEDAASARSQPPEALTDGLIRLGRDAALGAGLLGIGARHPEVSARLGDELVVSTGRSGIYHPYPDAPRLAGMHGGLTEAEMLVPLVLASL